MNPAPNAKPAIDWRLFPCFGKSILDNDEYKLTMMQYAWKYFRGLNVRYHSTNRGKTPMPPEFVEAFRRQVQLYSEYIFETDQISWLKKQGLFKDDFLDMLPDFHLNPNNVRAFIDDKGDFQIEVEGLWYQTILWEVPLLYIWSELYYEMTGKEADELVFTTHLEQKVHALNAAGAKVIDFGSRRRRSFEHHFRMVKYYHLHAPKTFLGTSNMHIAYTLDIPMKGTFAHEAGMAMQAIFGVLGANEMLLRLWTDLYGDKLQIALTDTFTTDFFLESLPDDLAYQYIGFRQDSGDPFVIGWKFINFWLSKGIDPMTRTIVFSDALDDDKAIALLKEFGGITNVVFGIGTFLSNDCGCKPLNIVIKLFEVEVEGEWVVVVKLSDTDGKHHGTTVAVEDAKGKILKFKKEEVPIVWKGLAKGWALAAA
jgi:nicotinate phosphoribosyltransferase